MLIRQYKKMSRKIRFVNAAFMTTASFAAVCVMPASANAFVSENQVVETVHSVKFTRSDLATTDGLKAVYAKMTSKAQRACAKGYNVNDEGEHVSKERCAANLLAQFVENADIDELTAFHESKAEISKAASL